MRKLIKTLILCAGFFVLFSYILFCNEKSFDPNNDILSVHFINVGYGDCTLIEFPCKKTMLIDCADRGARQCITEYLKSLSIKKINSLVITHPHPDHIGNFEYLVNNYNVENVVSGQDLSGKFKKKKINSSIMREGMEIKGFEGVLIEVMSPDKISEDLNDSSLVLKLTYKNVSFLFPADIGQKVCDSLAGKYKSILKCNVLKVPYHGKSGIGDFLGNVSPEAAVVSVGKSQWGGPYENILNEYKKEGIKVLRTDKNETIVIRTNGEKIWY